MGWAGINSLRCTMDAFYGTTVGNETVNFTSELCQILDDMMNRSQEPENVSDRETIFAVSITAWCVCIIFCRKATGR